MSLIQDIKKIKSERKDLRSFGVVVGVFFALLGGLSLWWHKGSYFVLLAISAILILGAWLAPDVLKPIQRAWMTAALCIGWVMTRFLLGLIFYLVLTPLGILGRLTGKHFLDLSFRTNDTTYWIKRPAQVWDPKRYEVQY